MLYVNLAICIGLYRFADLDPLMMIGDVLFINNFTGRGINLVTWSLSHEMQYYLAAPFIYLMFRKLTGGKRIAGALAMLAITHSRSDGCCRRWASLTAVCGRLLCQPPRPSGRQRPR